MKVSKEVAQFYSTLFTATPGLVDVFLASTTPEISAIAKAHDAYVAYETPEEDTQAIGYLLFHAAHGHMFNIQ